MADVLFISENYVKQNSVIDENVDVKLLLPTIKDVQEIYLHPTLGTSLYYDLIDKISNGSTNANEDVLLKSYIAPMLLKFVMLDTTINQLFRYRNKNVSTKSSDNSQPIDYQQMNFLVDNWKIKAEFHKQRLIDYLCTNAELFPKYCAEDNRGELYPEKKTNVCSFYLG